MLRLLQGDVGSGKTIVALLTLANVFKKNIQAALMVPTELLAIQHYNYFSDLFKDTKVNIVLLTSKINSKEKESVQKKIENGKAQIIIGTHAIFQKNINFKDLGYVVIDEQHRFGVHQKFQLSAKGCNPHILVMTATPIPRTLALTMYGNMNISKILKNKWTWVAVVFVFIGYQLMDDFLTYDYTGDENFSQNDDDQMKAKEAGSTMQD